MSFCAAAALLAVAAVSGGTAPPAIDAGPPRDSTASVPDTPPGKPPRTKEVPALPPEQAGWTGKVEQDFNMFNDFAYELSAPAGKLRLEFVKADLVEGEGEGLYVTAIVGGARKLVAEFRDVNAGNQTYLLVKPIAKGKALGVAIMSNWGDPRSGRPEADRAVEIRWDGKAARAKTSDGGRWAR